MNSFIPWVGGKSQLREKIIQLFPESPKSYIEVFGGAGWVLFAREKHAQLEVFNDYNSNLINLYRCIQHHCEALVKELELGGGQILVNSRELLFDYQAQLDIRGLTDIQRAARYYYIIRASYGATGKNFNCTKRILDNSLKVLPDIQQRLKNVVIENNDFERILKTYDKESSLFYCDPPYYNAEKYYQGFTPDDHLRLYKALSNIRSNFILSYNDTPEIRKLYSGFCIREAERNDNLKAKTGAGVKKYKELIITNY